MRILNKVGLLANTVIRLKPTQLYYQLANRLCRCSKVKDVAYARIAKAPSVLNHYSIVVPELDFNSEYLKRYSIKTISKGEIEILHEKHSITDGIWNIAEASHLWNYNLHYLEFLIPLAVSAAYNDESAYKLWKEYLTSWMENGGKDSFEPYTISLRIPNILICVELLKEQIYSDKAFTKKITDSIYGQYLYLQKHRELWLLANHYFENLKTLVICSLFFKEEKKFTKYYREFLHQVKEQILTDGVHYERSVMYHKIILEDMIRVCVFLGSCGKTSECEELKATIDKMSSALFSLEKGIGRTPLFNDSGDNVAKTTEALTSAAERITGKAAVYSDVLAYSGYYRMTEGHVSLIADCGVTGPLYMGGHAHCDCLSFELSVDSKPLFVNSGTYQYQGDKRTHFRSTRAHNTITVDGKEQSECWGEHRLARRIHDVSAEMNGNTLRGTYTSFLGDKHSRTITLEDNTLKVTDTTVCAPGNTVNSYLHIAPGYSVESKDGVVYIDLGEFLAEVHANECDYKLHTSGELCSYSPEFGLLQQGACLEFTWKSDTNQHGYTIIF